MCGICGIFRTGSEPVPHGQVAAMIATLRHRGPDGEGSYLAPGLGFGFTRLRIIDLSPASDQPFIDEAADMALVFNGEIYNYLELRSELKAKGHDFRSQGDGEVILRAYQEWGADCVQRFNGMFAFAIWDGRKRELFLARDRFGEKPLFIARSPRGVVFASEMKAILAVRPELRRPNMKAIYRYISRGDLDLDEESFFAGITSLPASHYLVLDDQMRGTPQRYWRPTSAVVPSSGKAAVERLRELLFDSIRLRLRSDVPVGSSLSGGLDSSSIVATINAQKSSQQVHQRTFSARFKSAAHDEGHYIDRVTYEVDAEAHEVWIEPERFIEEFEDLQWHQEEPIASASPYAQYMVMRLAKEHDTTVLLDGQGADELLAGYDQAHGMFWAHWLRHGRVDKLAREALAFMRRYHSGLRDPALFAGYYLLPGGFRDALAERYYRSGRVITPALHDSFAPAHVDTLEPFPDRLRNELVRWQTGTQLPEFLRYADRNSMAFSREVRLPFLDHRLVEYCFGLPPDLLLRRAVTKVALRQAMRGIVPDEILDRRDKLAYAPPQRQWIHGPLRPWMERYLAAAERRTDVFSPKEVLRLREGLWHDGHEALAWRVASTEAWYQTMIENTARSRHPDPELSRMEW
jgi:asparagine synthase (glutamine-hydrolysing)